MMTTQTNNALRNVQQDLACSPLCPSLCSATSQDLSCPECHVLRDLACDSSSAGSASCSTGNTDLQSVMWGDLQSPPQSLGAHPNPGSAGSASCSTLNVQQDLACSPSIPSPQDDSCGASTQQPYPLSALMYGLDIRQPERLHLSSYEELKEMLTDSALQDTISTLRAETDPEQRKAIKLQLPYLLAGVFDGARRNDRMLQMNGMIFDLDKVGNPEQMKREVLPRIDCIKLAYTSPNRGLKLFVPFAYPIFRSARDFELIYRYVQRQVDAITGIAVNGNRK